MSMYVVTGGAGFIGSHLVQALVESDQQVRVFDNFSTGSIDNLALFTSSIEVIEGDVRDGEALSAAFKGADYVLHQAAQVSASHSVEDPLTTDSVNLRGTLNTLLTARSTGVKRVVIASSCAIYGDTERLPIDESTPAAPLSPYAVSKLSAEYYARMFHSLYGLETACLRYFNVYGPRQAPGSQYAAAIPIFIELLRGGRRPTVYGDGEQTRDFIYVGDVARANLAACHHSSAPGGVFNIGGGARISINDLLHTLGRLLGRDPDPIYASERPGDIKHSAADTSLAQRVLDFEPQTNLEEGLRRTLDWFKTRELNS